MTKISQTYFIGFSSFFIEKVSCAGTLIAAVCWGIEHKFFKRTIARVKGIERVAGQLKVLHVRIVY